jgi:uncharacterized protein VirK/YbjX
VARAAQALYKVPEALLAALQSPKASFRWIRFLWSNQFAQLRLRHYFGAGLILAEFPGKSGTFYRVVSGTHRLCHNEGEMLLKIQTFKGDVVCFAIVTIGSSKNRKLQIELGTIQGQSKNTDFSVTALATRDFLALRPIHLLMAIVYSVARNWKIDTIVCVATRTHANHTNALCYRDCDTLWNQLGGQLNFDTGFYLLPFRFTYGIGVNQGRKHRSRHRRRTELKNEIFKMVENSLTRALPRKSSTQ